MFIKVIEVFLVRLDKFKRCRKDEGGGIRGPRLT